jgi:hypothetical protein
VDICILSFDCGEAHFAKQMQAVRGGGDAHSLEVGSGKGGELGVREGGDGAEVFGFVF